jgi:hypothetical protein
MLLRLPAVRAAMGALVPLPCLQDHVKALVDTFVIRAPLPFLDEALVDALVAVTLLAAERSRLPELVVLWECQKMEAFLGSLGLSLELFSCLVDAIVPSR